MKRITDRLKTWLFAKDAFDILLFACAAYGIQLLLPWLFGEALVPAIGMTYISKSIASIAAASIIIWGSWTIFKILMSFCTDYFEEEFIADIKNIRKCEHPQSIYPFIRPLFFLLLYFAWLSVVVSVTAARIF